MDIKTLMEVDSEARQYELWEQKKEKSNTEHDRFKKEIGGME